MNSLRVSIARIFSVVASCLLILQSAPASAQTREDLRAQYRAECEALSSKVRGTSRDECVRQKMRASTASESLPAGSELKLLENTFGTEAGNIAPADAKGVIYFISGWQRRGDLDSFGDPPYFLRTAAQDGWRVISGKISQENNYKIYGLSAARPVANFIARRVKELKAEGYKKVVIFGHALGAYAAMFAARESGADALMLNDPNVNGPRVQGGRVNSDYKLSLTEFGPAIENVKVPTVLMLFHQRLIGAASDVANEYTPEEVVPIARKHFEQSGVPLMLLNRPAGFEGHFAGFLPFFDYAYGECIRSFLQQPKSNPNCTLPRIANDDFRSIMEMKQLSAERKIRVTSAASLVGGYFDVYALNRERENLIYETDGRRIKRQKDVEVKEAYSFVNGQHCVGRACSTLIQWNANELLEFDEKTGALWAWWVRRAR